ncbi:hypothetical protein [Chryseobacterium caseinilyticum]|uniref:DUF4402 domain-containing protein n=1 Tax=Chryseobacterium caseinilyticum TaxID=2771428 RepID=A0ABR8ZFP0_9FLAO|nr:hypothetical protein [Chryseobacterium caseinilyticum]MBD8083680.1 hypothetical protein [Chryseobacterium caseinilyticum]
MLKFYLLIRLFAATLIFSATLVNAQINSGGSDWNITPTTNITEAGTDYPQNIPPYTSSQNQIVLSGTLPASLLSLFNSNSVKVGVHYLPTPNRWHNSLKIGVKRTGGTAVVNGLCFGCSANISNGPVTGFQLISDNSQLLFYINYNGGIGLGNSVSYSGVNIQLELIGISAVVPADAQAAILFTIMSP